MCLCERERDACSVFDHGIVSCDFMLTQSVSLEILVDYISNSPSVLVLMSVLC